MAQVVKLKRTAIQGKVPTTSNIELGELAVNTYDGRIFFEKSGSSESIQQVVTTDSITTGSINIIGNVTASAFFGDGSGLTNITAEISEKATLTASFEDSDDITITHNFNSYNVIVSVYDNNRNQIFPESISLPTVNSANVTLSGLHSGFAVVAKGGHLISGSQTSDDANNLNGQPGTYYLNWDNFNNVPVGIVSGSTQVDFYSTDSNPFTQSVNTITASGHFVPSQHETYDLGSSTLRWRDLYLSGSTIDLGGTKISRDASGNVELSDSGGTLKTLKVAELEIGTGAKKVKLKIDDNDKVRFEDSDSGTTEAPTYYKQSISGASTYNITHSLEEDYPIVQVYDSSKEHVIPLKIKSTSSTVVQLQFANTFAGTVVVKK